MVKGFAWFGGAVVATATFPFIAVYALGVSDPAYTSSMAIQVMLGLGCAFLIVGSFGYVICASVFNLNLRAASASAAGFLSAAVTWAIVYSVGKFVPELQSLLVAAGVAFLTGASSAWFAHMLSNNAFESGRAKERRAAQRGR